MSHVPQTELEQWAVLRTVVEAGSFAKAAQQLNRSQSSVSYAIARLQERLGVALLHVDGRRALLTDAGRLLLAEAVPLIDDLERLEHRGKLIAKGQEPDLRCAGRLPYHASLCRDPAQRGRSSPSSQSGGRAVRPCRDGVGFQGRPRTSLDGH